MTTKCELLVATQREINRARNRGRESISMDLETLLQAMQLDHRDGTGEVEAVLEEVCGVCDCECIRGWENHREVITFILSRDMASAL